MPTLHLPETTTATPEQFVAGLTDFGPGRAELFPNSADDQLGPGSADGGAQLLKVPSARLIVPTT